MARLRTPVAAALVALVLMLATTLPGCLPTATATPTPGGGLTPTALPTNAETGTATPSPTAAPLPTLTFGPTVAGGVEDAFAKYLAALPTNTLQSGVDALAKYKASMTPTTADLNLDAVFGNYLGFLYSLGFGLMDNFSALDAARKANPVQFAADLKAAGLMAIEVEGSFVLEPDYNVVHAQLADFLTPLGDEYCLMMIAASDNPVTAGYYELNISLTTLADMLADWDALISKLDGHQYPPSDSTYKAHFTAQEVRRRLQLDLLAFDNYNNEPMFDASDVMTQDFRDAYAYFLAKYPDSDSAQLVSDYVAALESHGWKRNADATAILTAADLQYMSTVELG
jgi:hypothetical protein